MKKGVVAMAGLVVLGLAGAWWVEAQKRSAPAFPTGYRSWYHVKSMVLQEGHPLYQDFGGIHHIYANPAAVEGLRTGTFKKGSVLVFDLFEATAEGGAITEGKRKVLAVMEKNPKQFAATGGWGFEAFPGGDPNQRLVKDAATQCFSCHQSQSSHDYVFSRRRE